MAYLFRRLAWGILVFTWFVTLFMSQASSPNYQALFWGLVPFATTHFTLTVYFFTRTHGCKRWLLVCFTTPALLSFFEMFSRAWLHVRMF